VSSLLGAGFAGAAQAQVREPSVAAAPASPVQCDGSGYQLTEGKPSYLLEITHYWHTDHWKPKGRITVPVVKTIRTGLTGSHHEETTSRVMSRALKYAKDRKRTPIAVTSSKSFKISPGFLWVPLTEHRAWGQYSVFSNTYRLTLCNSSNQIVWSDHGTWTVPTKGLKKTKS
jgi:hypothetical protein